MSDGGTGSADDRDVNQSIAVTLIKMLDQGHVMLIIRLEKQVYIML